MRYDYLVNKPVNFTDHFNVNWDYSEWNGKYNSSVVPFSIHGLRHTWMTAANAAGLSQYDIKMLANHSLPKGDVTAGYIGAHTESLCASQQRVTDYLRNYIIPADGACLTSAPLGQIVVIA